MTDPLDQRKNLARYLTPNLAKIARAVIKARPRRFTDTLSLRRFLLDDIRGQDLSIEKRQSLLYAFGPWEKLKLSVLDARAMPLPSDLTPRSAAELLALCKNLLDRSGDADLRAHFVEGWCGERMPTKALEEFCDKLWATRRNDPDFFVATVRGLHRSAARYVVGRRVPLGLKREQAIELIYRMALIWCAHDVQATTARAHLTMTRPFGWLHFGSAKRMKAATVFAIWRPRYNLLKTHLDRYRTSSEARGGKMEGKPTRHDEISTIKAEVEVSLDPSLLLKVKRSERDAVVEATREFVEITEDGFWDELRNPTGRYDGMQQSEVWYRGLTPLQMVALAVLRLIHAETVLKDRIVSMCDAEERGETISPLEFLPHSEQALPRGWQGRARKLVDDLRRAILDDSDHHSHRAATGSEYDEPSTYVAHFTAARRFIDEAMKEPLSADTASIKGKRHTLLLLSIAAGARFQR